MIKSFRDEETEKIFQRNVSKKFPLSLQRVAMRKLWMIDAATLLLDLRIPPGNHLKVLRGKMKDTYSIRINKQWRICFQWKGNDAYEVEIIDYH